MFGSGPWRALPAIVLLPGALLACGAGIAGGAGTHESDVNRMPDDATPDSVPVPFRVIPGARSQSSAHAEPAREVIRDTVEWARYWRGIIAQVAPAPPVPFVDFSRQFVVAASMGERPSGGYTIDIAAVYLQGGTVHIVVKSVSPGPGCGAAMVMTAPVVAVAIDRVAGPVRFMETTETRDCG